jgi:hypothetical protein
MRADLKWIKNGSNWSGNGLEWIESELKMDLARSQNHMISEAMKTVNTTQTAVQDGHTRETTGTTRTVALKVTPSWVPKQALR